ncbi:hypothetical protein H5410_016425, partial [Solanum commersonii]
MLQDTLARMLGLLKGMAQVGTLPVTSDALQNRVGGQTPDPMAERVKRFAKGLIILIRLEVSQVATSDVPFHNMGFEQREGKRTRHSDDYAGAQPRSRGYLGRGYHSQSSKLIHAAIPASEVGYAGYISLSLVHTPQGSFSRPVGCGGHSGHLGSSHQPTSRKGCFECGDMGHFVRDYLMTRRGGLTS